MRNLSTDFAKIKDLDTFTYRTLLARDCKTNLCDLKPYMIRQVTLVPALNDCKETDLMCLMLELKLIIVIIVIVIVKLNYSRNHALGTTNLTLAFI